MSKGEDGQENVNAEAEEAVDKEHGLNRSAADPAALRDAHVDEGKLYYRQEEAEEEGVDSDTCEC